MPDRRYVIGIAGPVGAGKSTLAVGLAQALADAAILQFDRYERITGQPIADIRQWMQNGADLDEMRIPGLAEALQSLKDGRAVIDPMTGASIGARKYILFETQFGRRHAATGRHIDLMVWVDTPLDVALARKVRQFAAGLGEGESAAARTFAPWLRGYLDNYLDVVGELLRIQKETVGAGADLCVDGERDPAALQQEVARLVRERLP
jgi:uridine kinase